MTQSITHPQGQHACEQEAKAASTACGKYGANPFPSASAMAPSIPCVYSRSSLSSIWKPCAKKSAP